MNRRILRRTANPVLLAIVVGIVLCYVVTGLLSVMCHFQTFLWRLSCGGL